MPCTAMYRVRPPYTRKSRPHTTIADEVELKDMRQDSPPLINCLLFLILCRSPASPAIFYGYFHGYWPSELASFAFRFPSPPWTLTIQHLIVVTFLSIFQMQDQTLSSPLYYISSRQLLKNPSFVSLLSMMLAASRGEQQHIPWTLHTGCL